MTEDTQLPEEEVPAEPVEEEVAAKAPIAEESAEPTGVFDETEPAPEAPVPAEDAPAPKPGPIRRAHPLWRGFWLAAVLLACFVLLEQTPSLGLAWLNQPMRAFAGAVLVGGCAASLPGILMGNNPEKPAWRRCLLAVLCGALWGVLA